ncbi:ribulose-phosphate 3-epimerase [Treponema pectinovorum]|uniref:ribulose-phosphate 3-epimerase n=1 Tax=Treponema pectinovorum TaxID=164 RepID=UPI0011C9C056|nr:ribulose-phosphate 3-epimerase [Treponema pectinovorum]
MKDKILSPSLLSADFSDLSKAIKFCEEKKAGFIHIDVMDGHFVPQISYGQPVIKSIKKLTSLPFDVHLMVERPEECVESFAESGADWITFHQEATVHIDRLISRIHQLGKKAGVSVVPSTPISAIENVLPLVDLVLVMSVNPGFGGQKFIPYCLEKVCLLDSMRKEKKYNYLISVDGGINEQNVQSVLEAGADVVVSGSAFFKGALNWEVL